MLGLALLGEAVEAVVGFRFAQRYGAFLGAALFEYSKARHSEGAVRAGWGAVLGRAVAAGVKMGVGIVLLVIGVFAALRS